MYKAKSEIKPFVNEYEDGSVKIYEYGGLNESMDIGVAEMTGKYPGGNKFAKNTKVECETYFVLGGYGKVIFEDGEEQEIKEGDCLFIAKNRGYQAIVEKGVVLKVLMASNPAWSPNQYQVYE